MNRYFRLYRDSMKRLAKMETILEEVYEPVLVLDMPDWKNNWHAARYESDWDQWVEIDYDIYDEPSLTALRSHKVTTAPQ